MLPLLARVSRIPHTFGFNNTDSNHVEARALNLREEMIPTDLPAIHITDSQNARKDYRDFRDNTKRSYRTYIRKVLPSVSKCEAIRMEMNIKLWNGKHETNIPQLDVDAHNHTHPYYSIYNILLNTMKKFTITARSWVHESSSKKPWPLDYMDENSL